MPSPIGRRLAPVMFSLAGALEKLLLTAWAGAAWFAGFYAAPRLFAFLPPAEAGNLAGELLSGVFFLALAALGWCLLRLVAGPARRLDVVLVVVALAIALCNELVLHPWIEALRDTLPRDPRFGMAHGISVVLYLVNAVLAAALVLRRR